MGGGTTMVMAARLERNYIGIDKGVAAVDVTSNRIHNDRGILAQFEIIKHYYAIEDLKTMPPFQFEK